MFKDINFNLKVYEQAALSGGSFFFLLSLPLMVDIDVLPIFYIYFAFAQASHGLMSNYVFLPILSGVQISESIIVKRILGMTFICAGMIWLFLFNNPNSIDFKITLFIGAVLFCPAMTIIDIYRLVLVRTSFGLKCSLVVNIIRWLVPAMLTFYFDLNPIHSIVYTLLPLVILLLFSNIKLAENELGKQKSNNEFFDFAFAFVMAFWGYVTTWSISGGQLNLITQYYAARNTLNFINTIIQFIEVHVFSSSQKGKKLVTDFLVDFKLVSATWIMFFVVGIVTILVYFKLVGLGSIRFPLVLTVLMTVYFQSINRLFMVVLRSKKKFKLNLLKIFMFASLGCLLLVLNISESMMIHFYAPLIFSVIISVGLYALNKKDQNA